MKVGVFDSGIGGLTILRQLIKKHPSNHYIYYGDTLNVPYGNKSKKEIMDLSQKIINYFLIRKVDMIIIACGTINAMIYDELIKKYDIPLINILKITIDYLKKKDDKYIILATENTINTHIFQTNLKNVTEIACPQFVPLIEKDKIDEEKLNKEIANYLKDVKGSIVLGCTHYPLIINYLKKYIDTTYYDMGVIVADNIFLTDTYSKLEIYFSKIYPNLEKKVKNILDKNVNIKQLTLD